MVRKFVPAVSRLRVRGEAEPTAGERDLFRLKHRSVSPPPLSTPLRCPLPPRQAPATASDQVPRAWHSPGGRTAPGPLPGKSRLQTFQETLQREPQGEGVPESLVMSVTFTRGLRVSPPRRVHRSDSENHSRAAHHVPDTTQGLSFPVLMSSRPHHSPKVRTIYGLHVTRRKTRI